MAKGMVKVKQIFKEFRLNYWVLLARVHLEIYNNIDRYCDQQDVTGSYSYMVCYFQWLLF
jgi:hypothetical protein